jgi:serine/threonine protein kinase
VTRPGVTPGTTAHMAPEQLRGDPVDRRCDVYALGVLTYQMITGGHLPYDAPDRALYHAQMTQPPIDPRQRCTNVLAEAVGPILAAIHPDPAQRPTTAGAFCLMLARVLVAQTPAADGMAILQRRAPRLLVTTNHHETLRAPGVTNVRGAAAWSYSYGAPLGKGGLGEVFRGVKHGAGFALPVAIKGKPGYLSPEQAATSIALDGGSDLFSVGIMLWELLAGGSLFERNNDLRTTIAAVLFAPTPRAAVSRPDVPPDPGVQRPDPGNEFTSSFTRRRPGR